ncbi:poly [ADP-ribose] polymerase-like [Contarinia nasturtii]|uniref:poly [ADP-ribose] polymerase-like n=1 Tax=Contarinia nasturtii TaxID=265458 RepID=UPI0012D4AAE0|nr:poly [ADP-ribose] polymerase-like [Contarinia nasturtii]
MSSILPYRAEYSPHEQFFCRNCRKYIQSGHVKIGFMQQSTKDDCLEVQLFHMECFFKLRRPASEDHIDGFANLRYADQMTIRTYLGVDNNFPSTSAADEPPTKLKFVPTLEQQIEEQTNSMFVTYDKLKNLKDADWVAILTEMKQFVPETSINKLNHVCDIISFGALAPCPTCKDGKLVFANSIYRCTGYVTVWIKCQYSIKEPTRMPIQIPDAYKELLGSNFKIFGPRILRNVSEFNADEFEQYTKQPLFNLEFVIIGDTKYPRNVIENKIRAMGGKVTSGPIHSRIAAVISNADAVNKGDKEVNNACIYSIQVISDELLDQVMDNDPIDLIVKNDLSKWGRNPYDRIPERKCLFNVEYKATSYDNERLWKNSIVYCEDSLRYEVVLNFVEISMNRNSFIKLQLVKEGNSKYWVCEKKGRINANLTGCCSQRSYMTLVDAKYAFHQIYQDKTGNTFGAKTFEKKSGKYNLVNVDYYVLNQYVQNNNVPTKLSEPIYKLMELLFVGRVMNSSLLAFCFVDFERMPLGKICKTQIQCALNLLGEILSMLSTGDSHEIEGASNQFYSYFPHESGVSPPPVINTAEMIQQKINLLQDLLQKDLKYENITSATYKKRNLLDICYEHLQDSAEITMLNKSSGMYKQICNYIINTQLNGTVNPVTKFSQNAVAFEVDEVFEVARHEEFYRYQPHEENFNRQLLFHGSPIQNFVGILTNGLKIAPPEAHFHGAIFGRGIYFSDSAKKSAGYCCPTNGTGLLLLCEVAAGLTDVRYVSNTAKKIDHCESVQAIGQYQPDPLHIRPDGLKIPNGKLIRRTETTGIDFNEFVITDESRVKVRYMVKLKFHPQEAPISW